MKMKQNEAIARDIGMFPTTRFTRLDLVLVTHNLIIVTLEVSIEVTNTGVRTGDEVVQLYIRDLVGSVTRPVKELKGFQRISLKPGEKQLVTFELAAKDLSFYRLDMSFGPEPGRFIVYIGGDSQTQKQATFELIASVLNSL
jgi:hypothetical protein